MALRTKCPVMQAKEHASKINKARWQFFTKVVQVVLDANGLIFGGAVRDIYARDYAARQFYQTVGYPRATEFYMDTEYHEEYKDRIMIPKDLDATLHETKLEEFLIQLKAKNMLVKTLFCRDAKTYLPNIKVETGEIMHYRMVIRPNIFVKFDRPSFMMELFEEEFEAMLTKASQIKQEIGIVYLDLLVNKTNKELDPPFGDLDFECNGLVLSKDGIRMSRCLHERWVTRTLPIELDERLSKIKEDILKKRAVPIPQEMTPKMAYRTSKMILKGYEIVLEDILSIEPDLINSSTTMEHPIHIDASDSDTMSSKEDNTPYCIVCHEDLTTTRHYKLSCCEARYHEKCLVLAAYKGSSAITRTQTCIMCRQRVPQPIRNELELFRCRFVTTADEKDIPSDIELAPEEEETYRPYPLRQWSNRPTTPTPFSVTSGSLNNEVRRMSDVD